IRVVGRVEHLGSKLQSHTLCEREGLADAEIKLEQSMAADDIASRIAEWLRWIGWDWKRVDVDVVADVSVRGQRGPDDIRAIGKAATEVVERDGDLLRGRRRIRGIQRLTAPQVVDRGKLPASDGVIKRAVHARAELPSSSDGKIVHDAGGVV